MLLTGRAGESESERSAAGGARGRLARRLVAQASDRRRAAVIVELVSPRLPRGLRVESRGEEINFPATNSTPRRPLRVIRYLPFGLWYSQIACLRGRAVSIEPLNLPYARDSPGGMTTSRQLLKEESGQYTPKLVAVFYGQSTVQSRRGLMGN